MGHSVEAVMEELNCEQKTVEPWLALARGKIPADGLTDHLAASVAAAVTLRRAWRNAGTDLDRFFVKLAFYTPPKDDWIVVRLPRHHPLIFDRGEVDISRARQVGYVTVFDPTAFLQSLKRRRADGRSSMPFVVELDDQLGPRRSQDKPNLYVGQTIEPPEKRIEQLVNGVAGPDWIRGHVLRGRPDLIHARFDGSKAELARKLSAAGYTVNRDTTVWYVYVIDLDDRALPDTDRWPHYQGWVYVGETSIPLAARFEQHKSGARTKNGKTSLSNPKVRDHGIGINVELTGYEVLFSQKAAKVAEKRRAAQIGAHGYLVERDH